MKELSSEAEKIYNLQRGCDHRERLFMGADIGSDGDETEKLNVEVCCRCGLEIRIAK